MKPTVPCRHWCVEVERKFRYEPVFINRFKANSGSPAFASLEYLGQSKFTDKYFDDPVSTLFRRGVWVRQRGTKWQAKIRQGGIISTRNFESYRVQTISVGWSSCTYNIEYSPLGSDKSFGLTRMARFTTNREAWKADKKFKIVLDKTDFGHSVGEVELELEMDPNNDENEAL